MRGAGRGLCHRRCVGWSSGVTAATVSQLFVYPIKSVGGVALRESVLEPRGLRHDRRWMLVDEDGRFMSQRRTPRMALISTGMSAGRLLVDAPGMPGLSLSLRPEARRRIEVRVFADTTQGAPVDEEADRWFTRFLGVNSRLVYMPDDAVRAPDPRYAADGDRIGFADSFPSLLTTEASLADLNARLRDPVPMDRFRPNLVVAGCGPFAEDGWRRVRVGSVPFRVAKPCARCSVTMVDQSTGTRGQEPLRTLARYRRTDDGVIFGQNLIPDSPGTLRVGDAVLPFDP